ncbi:IucA/IucC family C-terminal-domain containing protein [Glycomyces halotolerans]
MSAAAVDFTRPVPREFAPRHPGFPDLLAPLRTAADHIERVHGPQPLMGLRPWLDGYDAPEGVQLTGSALADGSRIDELLADSERLWGGSPHASAALAWKTYCYWALLPVVLGYLAARRIPVLEADDFVFTIADTGEPMFSGRQTRPRFLALPDDPMSGAPGIEIVADERELLERARTSLLEGHLDPVLEAIRREVRIGRRTLLGSLASGIAYATATCSSAGREPAEEVAATLLETFGVAELVDVSTDPGGRLVYQRHTCCLAFTIDGCGTCATCCVQSEHR